MAEQGGFAKRRSCPRIEDIPVFALTVTSETKAPEPPKLRMGHNVERVKINMCLTMHTKGCHIHPVVLCCLQHMLRYVHLRLNMTTDVVWFKTVLAKEHMCARMHFRKRPYFLALYLSSSRSTKDQTLRAKRTVIPNFIQEH